MFIQNPDATYDVYIASYSVVLSSAGPRAVIRAGTDIWSDNSDDIYGIVEGGSSGVTVLGVVEYHDRD